MHENLYGVRLSVFVAIVLTIASTVRIALGCAAQEAATRPAGSQQPVEPRWQTDVLKNVEAFRALFKPRAYGAGGSEMVQWDPGSPKGGEERIAQLQEAIRKYPKSPYADDAALLLARAYFLYGTDTAKGIGASVVGPKGKKRSVSRAVYGRDAEKAIAGLYDVVKEYPNGDWIAEDTIVLRDIAVVMSPGYEPERGMKVLSSKTQYMHEVRSYMDYVSKHPNRTSDEAKVCIAWIIFTTRKEERYQEAEDLLRGVMARYRDAGRTQADLEAAKQLENELIETELPRTERRASSLLIRLLTVEGKHSAAVEAAEEYARLYKGHPSVKEILQNVQGLRRPTTHGADSK